MQPIISVVGKSDSGKTTLLEELIAELKRRGYKVAVIKHSAEDVELDTVNKDTWRFSQAGSDVSAISSAHRLAIFKKLEHDLTPSELTCLSAWDCDLILTEGYKQSSYPKIEVHRREQGEDMVSQQEQIIAVVTDEPIKLDVPQFTKSDVPKLVNFLEKAILFQKKEDDLDLFINNEYVPVEQPFRSLLARTLIAMTSGKKDDKKLKSLHVSLRRKT